MLNFSNLSGKKEVKVYSEEEVLVTSTKGDIRLTPLTQTKLGVKDGDYLATVSPNDENGNPIAGKVYIAKGKTGVPVLDENGKEVKGANNHTLIVEGSAYGSILRTASEGSSLLRASASVAWQNIGGDLNKVKTFSLGEPQEGQVPTGNKTADGEDELFTGTFYELIFKSEKTKAIRKVKAGEAVAVTGEAVTTDAPTTENAEAQVEPTAENVEDDFENEEYEEEVE